MNITNKDLKKDIGRKIKECRLRMEFTQNDMAEKFGVTQNAFSSWENGRTQPPQTTLVSLSAFFGVDYKWLACIEDSGLSNIPVVQGQNGKQNAKPDIVLTADEETLINSLREADTFTRIEAFSAAFKILHKEGSKD